MHFYTAHSTRSIVTDDSIAWFVSLSVSLFVCQSVCHTAALCKNGWVDRGPVWGGDSLGARNIVLDGSTRIPVFLHAVDEAFARLLWKLVICKSVAGKWPDEIRHDKKLSEQPLIGVQINYSHKHTWRRKECFEEVYSSGRWHYESEKLYYPTSLDGWLNLISALTDYRPTNMQSCSHNSPSSDRVPRQYG